MTNPISLTLAQKFPLLNDNMSLEEQIRTINDIRLGMFTTEMTQSKLNTELDNLLPGLSESELCTLLMNLTAAYAKCKSFEEKQKKIKIAIEVNERDTAKVQGIEKTRKTKVIKKAPKDEKQIEILSLNGKGEEVISRIPASYANGLIYDTDPVINKAIKEMVKMTNSYPQAIAMLKSISALPADYQLKANV